MAVPEASIGWGVPLSESPVGWSPHHSIRHLIDATSPLLDPEPQGSSEDYWTQLAVIAVGYVGYPRSAPAVYIARTLTTSGDSTGDVNPKSLTPPTAGELEMITRYLDEAGFTGDRTVRLLLTAYEV